MPAMRACIASMAVFALVACSDPRGRQPPPVSDSELGIRIDALMVETIVPGTKACLRGEGFLAGAQVSVSVTPLGGGASTILPASRVDDLTLEVVFPPDVLAGLGQGAIDTVIGVDLALGDGRGHAERVQTLRVFETLSPTVGSVARAAYPVSPLTIRGTGFLEPGEGEPRVELRGDFRRERDGNSVAVDIRDAVGRRPKGTGCAVWARDELEFVFQPSWMGIEPGKFQGEIRVVNAGPGWTQASEWLPISIDQLAPVIEEVTPDAASRGQRVDIFGQGFIGGMPRALTVLRLEGVFRPLSGETVPLEPPVEISPEWIDGTELRFTFNPQFERRSGQCRSDDLGAFPGVLEGRATPIISWEGVTVEGASQPLTFEILPTRQVIWLKFLPAFTDSLRLFGLRNVSRLVQDRVIEGIERDYENINLEIRFAEPTDFLQYSIVEIGGPDPNSNDLFGLDNSPGLDRCNQRLDDNLAGHNADGGGFGGIFVEAFLQLSAAKHPEHPLSSPVFDDIFGPVISRSVEPTEYPDGPRAAVIARAIETLGSLVGNTTSHEIGHSLGLPVVPGCGQYHNGAGELQIMDCGQDRPFEERAELDGHPNARFNEKNLEYLREILPRP